MWIHSTSSPSQRLVRSMTVVHQHKERAQHTVDGHGQAREDDLRSFVIELESPWTRGTRNLARFRATHHDPQPQERPQVSSQCISTRPRMSNTSRRLVTRHSLKVTRNCRKWWVCNCSKSKNNRSSSHCPKAVDFRLQSQGTPKSQNGHVGVQLALSKCGDSVHCHWCLFDNITAGTADTSVDSNAQETSLEQDARNEVFLPVAIQTVEFSIRPRMNSTSCRRDRTVEPSKYPEYGNRLDRHTHGVPTTRPTPESPWTRGKRVTVPSHTSRPQAQEGKTLQTVSQAITAPGKLDAATASPTTATKEKVSSEHDETLGKEPPS